MHSFIRSVQVNIFKIYSGFVDNDKIEQYAQNRTKFLAKGKGSSFKDAVRQIDEYISDPMVQPFQIFWLDMTIYFGRLFYCIFRHSDLMHLSSPS